MNTLTLGCFCTARIGRADIDVANRAVDRGSRARQLCYPRSNFSVMPTPQSRRSRSSLDQTFVTGLDCGTIPVRLAFILALYTGFLTRLSQPLGAIDIFSTACHPSQTVHQQLSRLCRLAARNSKNGVTLAPPQDLVTLLQRLPFTLYNEFPVTTTGYSKVSRGLRFPLEFSGFCTRKECSEGSS